MDAKRFDTLARALGSSTSRRQVLRAVVGAAAGGVLGALGLHRLVAADESETGVAGTPTPTSESTVAPEPSPTATAQPTVTPDPTPESEACPEGRTACGDTCADLAFEQEHCGACGAACGGGTLCTDGACACFPGAIACGGECVNPFCDPTHCGGCGVVCAVGEACVDGACAPAPSNWTAVPVPASFGWVDSGIDVAAGQVLGIRANGVVAAFPGDGGRPPVGTRGCLASPRALAPDLACHALVGRIGSDAPFELGYGTGFVAPSSGRLLLGVNDDSPEDNAGAFTAFVTVSEGTPTEPTSTPTAVAPSKGGGKPPTGAQAATTSCVGTGAACASNAACCSGVCVNGTCKASRVALGGVCDETADCVSGLLCRSGNCCKDAMLTCGANGDCCSGACQNGSCCKPVNTFCDAVNPCCPGYTCQNNACCRAAGGACANNTQCCSDVCVDGVCAAGPVAVGGVCDETPDCASPLLCRSGQCCKDVPLTCSANGQCCSGSCVNGACCKPSNSSCSSGSCCPGSVCADGVCCRPNGSACPNNAHCCSGICVSGVCLADPVPLGGVCDNSSDCVTDLLCRTGKCCKDVPLACSADGDCCSGACQNGTCCKPNDTSCTGSGECCSGICTNGTCMPASPGQACDDNRDCDSASVCAAGICCRAAGAACTSSANCCSGGCFDDKCTDAIAVVDVTSISDCEIEIIEYADEEQTTVISTTGSQMCGPGSVIHSFAMPQVSAAEESGYDYVVLSGDPSIDEAAIDGLIEALLPVDADPGGGVEEDEGEGEVTANATCVSGSYPAYYAASGSYLTYLWDDGPVDVRIRWQLFYKRVSCTRYEINYARQWLASATMQPRGLWWQSIKYSRLSNPSGVMCTSNVPFCTKHQGYGGQNAILRYPKNYCWPSGSPYRIRPGGLFTIKSTNDGRDGCHWLGETWTGGAYLYGPSQ